MAKSIKLQLEVELGTSEISENVIPDSILLEIFNYLSFIELSRASRVCKTWYRVAHDDSLRKIIDVRGKSLSIKQVWKLLRYQCTPILRDLRLKGYVFLSKGKPNWRRATVSQAVLSKLQKQCPDIKTLCLEEVFLGAHVNGNGLNICNFPRTLTCLSFKKSFLHCDKLFGTNASKYLPYLEHLDLSYCTLVCSHDMIYFSEFKHLKKLYINGCYRINDGGLEHISSIFCNLQVLDVEETDICNNSIIAILKNGINLKELYIGHNLITDIPFVTITKSSSLEILCLQNTLVTDCTLKSFADVFSNLKHLNIQGTKISEKKIKEHLNVKLPNCFVKCDKTFAKCDHSSAHWLCHQKY
ncbi:F-box/LRR-repeat protein 12-like [Centruroides sculpturatus]|uniref:F-box/LRR-repeat protein 12-like n=1 Tax=Centruroides sculpturatus TaxID=218467 RepID=UPI000C6DCA12|nr:F-box/LRR-repeat protein 12-like [Centruroides sculpturatus]